MHVFIGTSILSWEKNIFSWQFTKLSTNKAACKTTTKSGNKKYKSLSKVIVNIFSICGITYTVEQTFFIMNINEKTCLPREDYYYNLTLDTEDNKLVAGKNKDALSLFKFAR